MTLVQNHRPLLSGNKLWLLLVVLMFATQSCSIFQKKSKTPTPPPEIVEPVTDKEPEEEEVPDAPEIIDVVDEDTIKRDLPILKDVVNVGVILPFDLDNLQATNSFSTASKNSFQLYKGIRLALEDLELNDVDLKVHVLDNKRLDTRTKSLIADESFKDMDVVIGPLYPKNVRAVGLFAKQNEIPFISPLSSVTSLAVENPFIYSAVATKQTRYEVLFDYLKANYSNPNIGIMYQPLSKEVATKDEVVSVARQKGLTVTEQISEGAEMFSAVTNLLEAGRENIVLVPAGNDEEGQLYVDRLLGYLEFESNNFDITVVGMEEWNGYNSIAPSKFGVVKTLVLDRYFVDTYNSTVVSKMNDLRLRNGGKALTIYSLQGYDIMSYIGELIEMNGTDFMDEFGQRPYTGLQTQFIFDDFRNDFKENKFINIVRYNNGAWELQNR
ncbi:MAG: ABC transporter substrate-binding protein [Saprospiraceae bacterium]|nr:ABC transporter substrate-binding protein [Saprospiraceae bacterium]